MILVERKNKQYKLTKEERKQLFLQHCFILCPKCMTVHPFGTKTCSTCLEVLDPKERVFQKNLHNKIEKNKLHLIRVE